MQRNKIQSKYMNYCNYFTWISPLPPFQQVFIMLTFFLFCFNNNNKVVLWMLGKFWCFFVRGLVCETILTTTPNCSGSDKLEYSFLYWARASSCSCSGRCFTRFCKKGWENSKAVVTIPDSLSSINHIWYSVIKTLLFLLIKRSL